MGERHQGAAGAAALSAEDAATGSAAETAAADPGGAGGATGAMVKPRLFTWRSTAAPTAASPGSPARTRVRMPAATATFTSPTPGTRRRAFSIFAPQAAQSMPPTR